MSGQETGQPEEFTGFHDNVRRGRLAFPWCAACRQFHWYPMPRCPHCQADEVTWEPVSGQGELFSYTRIQHAFDKSRRGALPYIVGLITFEDAPGVRFVTNIVGADDGALEIGAAVEPVWPPADASDGCATGGALVCFRLA